MVKEISRRGGMPGVLCAATSAAAWAAESGFPIRLGVLTDMSGPFSFITGPGAVEAAKLAAEEFGGAIAGRRIEILAADHQNKPDIGVAIARRSGRIAMVSGAGTSDITGPAYGPTIFA